MKVKRDRICVIMDVLSLTLLVGTAVFLAVSWAGIPDEIPMHADLAGNIDRWGRKREILIIPGMSLLIFVPLSVIQMLPKAWNTGVTVTEENRKRVYSVIARCLSSLKLIITGYFSYMTVMTARSSRISALALALFLLAAVADLFYWLRRLSRAK